MIRFAVVPFRSQAPAQGQQPSGRLAVRPDRDVH